MKNGMTDGERERERRKKGKREKREKARNREPEKEKRGRREGGDTRSTDGFTSNESGGSSCYARYRLAES